MEEGKEFHMREIKEGNQDVPTDSNSVDPKRKLQLRHKITKCSKLV